MMEQMNRLVRVGGATECELLGRSGLALLRVGDWRFFTILVHVALACMDALGKVFFTSCGVSPGKEERKPASIALRSVEGTGEPNEA